MQNFISSKKPIFSKIIVFAAVGFLFIFSVVYSLSPAVKNQTWSVNFQWIHWIGFFIWIFSTFTILYKFRKAGKDFDLILFMTAQFLVGWGLLTIFRLRWLFGIRQSIWLIFCTVVLILTIHHEDVLDILKKYKYLWLIFGLFLVLLTFLFGTYPNGEGPRLWLGFRGIFFQPSELLKILFVIYICGYLSDNKLGSLSLFQILFPTFILVSSALLILIAQRDLGTALIFIAVYTLLIFIIFGKKRILAFGGVIVTIAGIFGFLLIDLIRIRFLAWISPWEDATAGSYQIIQSIIAIASGGVFGTGIGLGYPNIIPVSHSDFIFSAILEEMGLFGCIAMVILFLIILFRGLQISIRASNNFHRFLAAGISIYILSQAILIMGGNVRLLPITGVTLPFISYGGSSLITVYFALGILLLISSQPKTIQKGNSSFLPYKIISGIFVGAFVLIALICGWWSVIRAKDLQNRYDNPRNLIQNKYIERGKILDRNNSVLAESIGVVGDFERQYPYAPLSNSIGYIHQTYGIVGLEKAYNDYLIGDKGYPAHQIWLTHLLYDHSIKGRSIRTTIDLSLQIILDNYLIEKRGAAVLLNAESGEIFALSTSPFLDANLLDMKYESWKSDQEFPLINRATQGAYPMDGLLAPLLLYNLESPDLLEVSAEINFPDQQIIGCEPFNPKSSEVLQKGCQSALDRILQKIKGKIKEDPPQINILLESYDIGLPTYQTKPFDTLDEIINLSAGGEEIRINPLQFAAALSPLSNDGIAVVPKLISAIHTYPNEWVVLEKNPTKIVANNEKNQVIVDFYESKKINGWEITAVSKDLNSAYRWYIAGTGTTWKGTPIILLMVTEEEAIIDDFSTERNVFDSVVNSSLINATDE